MQRCIVMHHVMIWHRLINVDALPQDRNKKHITGTFQDFLVSGTTTDGAVMLVSLQNGNSFSNPQRAAGSHLWGSLQPCGSTLDFMISLIRPTRFAVFSVFHQQRGLSCKWSSPWSKLSRSKCKCLHSHKIKYFVSLKNTSKLFCSLVQFVVLQELS